MPVCWADVFLISFAPILKKGGSHGGTRLTDYQNANRLRCSVAAVWLICFSVCSEMVMVTRGVMFLFLEGSFFSHPCPLPRGEGKKGNFGIGVVRGESRGFVLLHQESFPCRVFGGLCYIFSPHPALPLKGGGIMGAYPALKGGGMMGAHPTLKGGGMRNAPFIKGRKFFLFWSDGVIVRVC